MKSFVSTVSQLSVKLLTSNLLFNNSKMKEILLQGSPQDRLLQTQATPLHWPKPTNTIGCTEENADKINQYNI